MGIQEQGTQLLNDIPFGKVIGGPLVAAVEAQAQAARSSVEFIQQVGFEKAGGQQGQPAGPGDDLGPVRTVTFKYKKGDPTDPTKAIDAELVVPLLTIVPIPFIRIDNLTLDFKTSINAETSTEKVESTGSSASAEATVGGSYWFVKASFKGSVSSKKDSTSTQKSKYSVEYTIDVNVHAVQDDMPAGMSKVLNILVDGIQPKR
jgi:hypothetical protein